MRAPSPYCARGVTLGASGAARARDPEPRAIEWRWRRRRVPGPAGWTGSPVPPLSPSSSCLGAWPGKLRPQGWKRGGRDGCKEPGPVHLWVCCSELCRHGVSVISSVLRVPQWAARAPLQGPFWTACGVVAQPPPGHLSFPAHCYAWPGYRGFQAIK